MPRITIRREFEFDLDTFLYVNEAGEFLGALAPAQSVVVDLGAVPERAVRLPDGTPEPPHPRCAWRGGEWVELPPSESEIRRQEAAAAAEAARRAALAKLEKVGLTEDDIRAIVG